MKNFTLKELGLTNLSDTKTATALTALVDNVLDPAREALGQPIKVNSGYRSLEHNKEIGGAPNSQHCKGEAADIELGSMSQAENKLLHDYIKDNLPFDQLINEKNYSWIHVSYKITGNRHQTLSL